MFFKYSLLILKHRFCGVFCQQCTILYFWHTGWKVSKYGVFYGANTGKYGPEKTPYLNTFHAVSCCFQGGP